MRCSKEKYGLYIHVPFCYKKCKYCHFYSVEKSGQESLIKKYIEGIKNEIIYWSNFGFQFETLYIGGGTPNSLTPGELDHILSNTFKHLKIDNNAEKSVEVNPGKLSKDFINVLNNYGFNRISIGAQSFVELELRILDREHTVNDTVETFETLRDFGFNNINFDLIFAFKGQTLENFRYSLEQTCNFNPEHVSTYSMTFEPPARENLEIQDDKIALKMIRMSERILSQCGLKRYEISNFSKRGFECIHNLKYWLRHYYIGIGPSASGFYRLEGKEIRYTNSPSFDWLKEGKAEFEVLNSEKQLIEEIFLKIRTKWGWQTDEKFCKKVKEELKSYISVKNNSLILTKKGILVADKIALKIFELYEDFKEGSGL